MADSERRASRRTRAATGGRSGGERAFDPVERDEGAPLAGPGREDDEPEVGQQDQPTGQHATHVNIQTDDELSDLNDNRDQGSQNISPSSSQRGELDEELELDQQAGYSGASQSDSSTDNASQPSQQVRQRNAAAMAARGQRRTTPRSLEEQASNQCLLRREHRPAQGTKQYATVQADATAGLAEGDKFRLLLQSDFDQTNVENGMDGDQHYSHTQRIERAWKGMRKYDFVPSVQRFDDASATAPSATLPKIDLLREHEDLDEEEVRRWQRFINELGSDYEIEESNWAQLYAENSSEAGLVIKVHEKYDKLPIPEQGGIMYWYLTLTAMSQEEEDLITYVKDKFKNEKLSDMEGCNVLDFATVTRSRISFLAKKNELPHNAVAILLTNLATSGVERFDSSIKAVEGQRNMPKSTGQSESKTPEQQMLLTLEDAEALYKTLMATDKDTGQTAWTPAIAAKGSKSVYTARSDGGGNGGSGGGGTRAPPPPDVVCHNCGKKGKHWASNCPEPLNLESEHRPAWARRKLEAKLKKEKEKATGGTKKGGKGRGNYPTKGPYRAPTQEEQSKGRMIHGHMHYTCKPCGGWQSEHEPGKHPKDGRGHNVPKSQVRAALGLDAPPAAPAPAPGIAPVPAPTALYAPTPATTMIPPPTAIQQPPIGYAAYPFPQGMPAQPPPLAGPPGPPPTGPIKQQSRLSYGIQK